jgi:hypothetical protein
MYQGILKREVSLYHWPPVWLVWNQLYDNWQFFLQNRLIQTSQTGGQWYNDTSPLVFPYCTEPSTLVSIPWFTYDKPRSGKSWLALAPAIDRVAAGLVVAVTLVAAVRPKCSGWAGLATIRTSPATRAPRSLNSAVQLDLIVNVFVSH